MGTIPWDKWLYNLPYRQQEVNNTHKEIVDRNNKVQASIADFKSTLSDVNKLLAVNSALTIVSATIALADPDWDKFNIDVSGGSVTLPSDTAADVIDVLDETASGGFIMKGVWQLGRLTKEWFSRGLPRNVEIAGARAAAVGAELGVNEGAIALVEVPVAAAENVGPSVTVAEAASFFARYSARSVALTGVAIAVTVGIDIIIGAIEGNREANALDAAINDLKAVLDKSKDFETQIAKMTGELEATTKEQMKIFSDLVFDLETITRERPSFTIGDPTKTSYLADYVKAAKIALTLYNDFVLIRTAFGNYMEKQKKAGKVPDRKTFMDALAIVSSLTDDQIGKYYDVLAGHSKAMADLS